MNRAFSSEYCQHCGQPLPTGFATGARSRSPDPRVRFADDVPDPDGPLGYEVLMKLGDGMPPEDIADDMDLTVASNGYGDAGPDRYAYTTNGVRSTLARARAARSPAEAGRVAGQLRWPCRCSRAVAGAACAGVLAAGVGLGQMRPDPAALRAGWRAAGVWVLAHNRAGPRSVAPGACQLVVV